MIASTQRCCTLTKAPLQLSGVQRSSNAAPTAGEALMQLRWSSNVAPTASGEAPMQLRQSSNVATAARAKLQCNSGGAQTQHRRRPMELQHITKGSGEAPMQRVADASWQRRRRGEPSLQAVEERCPVAIAAPPPVEICEDTTPLVLPGSIPATDEIQQLQHSSSTAPAAWHPTCSTTPATWIVDDARRTLTAATVVAGAVGC